jgi:ubiquinone/menaquinone biosynthesis C-methylase UbiE
MTSKVSIMESYIKHHIYKTIGTPHFIRQIEWRSMFEYLDPKEFESILDVACGEGVLSLKVAEKGCEVSGIDVSENAIENAKHLAEREEISCVFKVGSAEDLPYPDEHFDKIICSSSLEHFKDDVKALKEMYRVLKPHGKVVLTADSFTYLISDELKERHRKIAYVVNYYTRETLKERFEAAGFEMRRSDYLLNSWLTSLFFNFGIKIRWSGKLWIVVSFIAYPLCLMSDRLFGTKDGGVYVDCGGEKVGVI